MEVTTVSPSPASPTEGDDLCETDVTNVAIHSVTLLICLCGLAGNGAVLGLLRMGLIEDFIFELAVADFLFLLFTVPSSLLLLVEDLSCSPIVPLLYLSFHFYLSIVSCYWLMFLIVYRRDIFYFLEYSTLQDLFRLCCPVQFSWWPYLMERTVQLWAFFALFTVIPAVTNLCPSHQQQHCRAALISMYAVIVLLWAAPMLISITMVFIKAMRGSRNLKPKKRDIVLSLIVLYTLLLILYNSLQNLGYIIVPTQVLFLLTCIQSSIKPFIYFLAGRCWSPCTLSSLRLYLQRVFDEQEETPAHSNDAPMDTGVGAW